MRPERSLEKTTVSLLALALLALTTAACGAPQLGAAAKQGITKRLEAHRAAYTDCYEKALERQRSVAGKIVLAMTVSERGRLKSLSVSKNATGDKMLAQCVVTATRRASLPARLPGRVYLTYPLSFAQP